MLREFKSNGSDAFRFPEQGANFWQPLAFVLASSGGLWLFYLIVHMHLKSLFGPWTPLPTSSPFTVGCVRTRYGFHMISLI